MFEYDNWSGKFGQGIRIIFCKTLSGYGIHSYTMSEGGILARLPCDLQPLVLQHWAAGVIQVHMMRWHRYRHVRRRLWTRLRARMPRAVHATLLRCANVRHEWYREPASWLTQPDEVLVTILEEVKEGLWGRAISPSTCREWRRVDSTTCDTGRGGS